MAFQAYHNITYNSGLYHNGVSTGVNITLLNPGDEASDIKSILITNTHATSDATVSLYIQDQPTAAEANIYYLLSTVAIPSDTSLLLNESSMLQFDNEVGGYGLYLTVGSTDTLDILINR